MTDSNASHQSPREPLDFREIYESECAYVWHTLRRLGVRERDIEDVAHETLFTVFKRLADFDPSRPIRPWIFGFCYRFASDHRKRAHVRREIAAEEIETSDGAASVGLTEARAVVHRALEAVELDRRAVFVAHEIDGWSIPEVAVSLGIPLNTAYSRLRLARAEFEAAVRRLEATPLEKGAHG